MISIEKAKADYIVSTIEELATVEDSCRENMWSFGNMTSRIPADANCDMSYVRGDFYAVSVKEGEKAEILTTFATAVDEFIDLVATIDEEVAEYIETYEKEFYEDYDYLEPNYGWEIFAVIAGIVLSIAAIVLVVIAIVSGLAEVTAAAVIVVVLMVVGVYLVGAFSSLILTTLLDEDQELNFWEKITAFFVGGITSAVSFGLGAVNALAQVFTTWGLRALTATVAATSALVETIVLKLGELEMGEYVTFMEFFKEAQLSMILSALLSFVSVDNMNAYINWLDDIPEELGPKLAKIGMKEFLDEVFKANLLEGGIQKYLQSVFGDLFEVMLDPNSYSMSEDFTGAIEFSGDEFDIGDINISNIDVGDITISDSFNMNLDTDLNIDVDVDVDVELDFDFDLDLEFNYDFEHAVNVAFG